MSDYLFATWDGGGNVPPALALARRILDRGHRVRVLGHPGQRGSVEAVGLEFRAYATVPPFTGADPHSVLDMVRLFTDARLADDVVTECRRAPTDAVVVDCLLLPALRACARLGLPFVNLEHCFDGYLRRGWDRGPLGLAARLKRIPAKPQWDAATLTVVASAAGLDPGHDAARPGNRVWTGPFVEDTQPRDWTGQEPLVLVSLSTFCYPGMQQVLQRVVDAVASLDVPAVVTTGPVLDPGALHAPARVQVHRFVPHDRLMPQVSVVVGHGGHATTMRALAHDLPLVVVPMHPMLDQPIVGRQVEKAGAGRLLPKRSSVERLRDAIADLVADGTHRTVAARLGAQIRSADGLTRAADLVEQLDDPAQLQA